MEYQFGSEDLDFLRETLRDVLRERLSSYEYNGYPGGQIVENPSDPDWPAAVTRSITDLADGLASSDISWDVIANEVTSRLGERLRGIDGILEALLSHPGFREGLDDWNPPADFLLARAARREEARLRQRAIGALADFDVQGYAAALHELQKDFPDDSDVLGSELPDLDVLRGPLGRRVTALWRLLDARSPLRPRVDDLATTTAAPAFAADLPLKPAHDDPPSKIRAGPPRAQRRPEARGDDLEDAMHDVLEQLFDLSNPTQTGWRLRKQKHGEQYGFDLSFQAPTLEGHSLCLVECKNYTSPVSFDHVAGKILQAKANWPDTRIDHWILISPHTDPDNRLDRLLEQWSADREFPFSLQVWSPASGVQNLFLLSPTAYRRVYESSPPDVSAHALAGISRDFRSRIKPYLRIPGPFIRAAKDPRRFLHPSDRADWPLLLGAHLPRQGLTETRGPLPLPLVTTLLNWIATGRAETDTSTLILGDFGEGKSFLTFEVCVAQVERFAADPKSAAFPLRMVLKDYRNVTTPEQFLEGQLARLGASMVDYYELVRSCPVVIVLDGIDELSVRQDGAAITENLGKLRDLLDFLSGIPVLMTSRPHFFDSSSQRERFYDRLRRPVVYRLGQPSRSETFAYLHDYARTTNNVEKLLQLNRLYDPISLSGKMLFLEMVKATLPDLPKDHFSEVVLYNTYINQALRRKRHLLEDPDALLTDGQQFDALGRLLEDIAVVIHEDGYADLRRFTNRDTSMAAVLWRLADHNAGPSEHYSVDDDAAARVGMRSLLRKVTDESASGWRVDFFHRSLKEFFVARAVVRSLQADDDMAAARALLSRLTLQPEISRFVTELCEGLDAGQLHARLTALARSSVRALGESALGGNALTILHRCGADLSGQSWSDLCLDDAWLVGADLSESDLRRSSVRWANLDNAVLTAADLRDADLTGVRLDETSVVTDLTVDTLGRPVVLYGDNAIRRWESDRSHLLETLREFSDVQKSRIEMVDHGVLLVRGFDRVTMRLESSSGEWDEIASFSTGTFAVQRVASVGPEHLAIVFFDYDTSRQFVVVSGLQSGEVIWALRDVGPVLATCQNGLALVDGAGALAIHDPLSGNIRLRTDLRHVIGADLREDEEGIHIAAMLSNGDLRYLCLSASDQIEERGTLQALHERNAECVVWVAAGIASGGGGRDVVLTTADENGLHVSGRLARWLRCDGAKVSGLRGRQERAMLVAAGARE